MKLPSRFLYLNAVRGLPGGNIVLGYVAPYENIAMVHTADEMLAVLKWKEEEDLDQLLTRLDQAVGEAMDSGKVTNEMGGVFTVSRPKTRKVRR